MVRGHVMYGSPYRNYNRGGGGGFGRGQPRRFQPPPPQPQPRKGDVFEEAGRLAAEYLVSKGLLPPYALSGKWQNGSFKNQDFQFFRAQEGDNLLESRTSVLSRLGDVMDTGSASGRRRLIDDFNPNGSRDYMKGRRRIGSFKGYDSEGNREFGVSGSWYDKARVSPEMEGGDNAFPGNMEEQQIGSIEEHKSLPSCEVVLKNDSAGTSESEFEKHQVSANVGFNASSSSTTGIDISPETAVVSKESDAMKIGPVGTTEANDGSNNDESEKPSAPEDITIQHYAEEDVPADNGGSDLLALSRFAKVPTRTRSSLTIRGSKIDPVLIAEDEDPNESEHPRESGDPVEDVCTDVSLGDASLNQSHSLKYIERPEASAEQDARQLGLTYKVGQGICRRSESFPERSFTSEVELSEAELGFGRSSSMIIDRREKRALQHSDGGEGAKRLREWNPTDSLTEDFVHISNSMEKQQASHEGRPSSEQTILDADQHKMVDTSMYPDSGTGPCIEHAEEKQLFPGSFKICDLNLMEASDVHETHVADPLLLFQSIPQIKKEAEPIDIDLSMSSNGNATDKNGTRGADGKEVEVIDLENDSLQEDKTFNNSERKEETIFTGLESFPDQAQGVNEIPDGQDGYGLMISELLGADIPNCSPVQPDINSMHNEMGIHHEEGILGDDDSIYMSLGEIPISMPEI